VIGSPAAKPQTKKITTPYPVELIERARDAAYWDRTTLASILVKALADVLDRMEKERGESYPPGLRRLMTHGHGASRCWATSSRLP
jgi:hypothetical protein